MRTTSTNKTAGDSQGTVGPYLCAVSFEQVNIGHSEDNKHKQDSRRLTREGRTIPLCCQLCAGKCRSQWGQQAQTRQQEIHKGR